MEGRGERKGWIGGKRTDGVEREVREREGREGRNRR